MLAASNYELSNPVPHLRGHFIPKFLGPYTAPLFEQYVTHLMRVADIFPFLPHVRGKGWGLTRRPCPVMGLFISPTGIQDLLYPVCNLVGVLLASGRRLIINI